MDSGPTPLDHSIPIGGILLLSPLIEMHQIDLELISFERPIIFLDMLKT